MMASRAIVIDNLRDMAREGYVVRQYRRREEDEKKKMFLMSFAPSQLVFKSI